MTDHNVKFTQITDLSQYYKDIYQNRGRKALGL